MTLNEIFVKNMRSVMNDNKFSGLRLSEESSVSRSHMAKILNGEVGVTLATAQKICTALNVEPAVMMEE